MRSQSALQVTALAEGLWRWTTPHPEWTPEKDKPGGWARMVGAVYFEPPAGEADALALIDPLAPPLDSEEGRKFWAALDRDVERARLPVVILIGNGYHARGAVEFQRRYAAGHGAAILAHTDAVARLGFEPERLFEPGTPPCAGVKALPIEGLEAGETAFFIPRHRALVLADAVIGVGGGRLAVAPRSWAAEGEAAGILYRERFRTSLGQLLALDPALVLPSHGEPVLAGGRAALAAALEAPAWGED